MSDFRVGDLVRAKKHRLMIDEFINNMTKQEI